MNQGNKTDKQYLSELKLFIDFADVAQGAYVGAPAKFRPDIQSICSALSIKLEEYDNVEKLATRLTEIERCHTNKTDLEEETLVFAADNIYWSGIRRIPNVFDRIPHLWVGPQPTPEDTISLYLTPEQNAAFLVLKKIPGFEIQEVNAFNAGKITAIELWKTNLKRASSTLNFSTIPNLSHAMDTWN